MLRRPVAVPLVKCFNSQCTVEKGNGFTFMRSADQLDPGSSVANLRALWRKKLFVSMFRPLMLNAKCCEKPPWSGPKAEGRILDIALHIVL